MEYPMARTTAKPAAAKPAAKRGTAAKTPAAKPAVRKTAAKPAAKPAARPAAKTAGKPTSKPAAKPARTARQAAANIAKPTRGQAGGEARADAGPLRPRLVRDSFTMPEQEYAVLGAVKQACLKAGFEVKKSELLRIGVALLGQLDIAALRAVLGSLPQLKTGRPPGE
jgi:hypothetical protein